VDVDYVSITGSAASTTLSGEYYAGSHSTNGGGNSGWIFASYEHAPTVSDLAATNIALITATLNGQIISLGSFGAGVEWYFEYDVDSGAPYALSTTHVSTTDIGVKSAEVTGLTANDIYYFRMVIAYDAVPELYVYSDENAFLTIGVAQIDPNIVLGTGAADDLVTVPGAIPGMYDEGSTAGIPGADLLNDAITEADIPQPMIWYPLAFASAIILGFVAFAFTKELLIQCVISGVVMAFWCGQGTLGDGLLPYWTVVVFAIEAVSVLIIEHKFSW
jgi:hypothetical protein